MRKEIYLRSGKTLEGKFHKVPGVSTAPGSVTLQGPDHQEKQPPANLGGGASSAVHLLGLAELQGVAIRK